MLETRSGRATPINTNEFEIITIIKEKFDKLKTNLLSEIKELIHLEVEKAIKKQKEEFKSAIDKLQDRVTKLEHAHNDLEQCGCRLCIRVEDIPVATDVAAEKVLEKVENIFKKAFSNLSGNVTDQVHRIGNNYKCFKTNNT